MIAPGTAALALAEKGLLVFPVWARTKNPFTCHGFKDATADPNIIRGWWSAMPDLNVAIATGSGSGVWVLDIDGGDGEDTLRELEAVFGPLPRTVEAITGKGRRLYFAGRLAQKSATANCAPICPASNGAAMAVTSWHRQVSIPAVASTHGASIVPMNLQTLQSG